MIYTVTLNPSIDYVVRVDELTLGHVNRMTSDDKYPGGKGINVSRILSRLNFSTTALGFIGGFTGKFVEEAMRNEQVETQFVTVDQDTRINVKVKGNVETEINGTGPVVTKEQVDRLTKQLSQLTAEDVVVFAGSAPANLGNDIYKTLIPIARQTGAQVVCDFEGQNLVDSLSHQPLLVKPNNHELAAIFDVELQSMEDIANYGQKLLEKGAQYALISMAGDGALLICKEGNYFAKPIKGQVKNSVGAGDSMVAGFTGAYNQTKDPIEALKWGVACGTATAFADDLATKDAIDAMYQKVEVERL